MGGCSMTDVSVEYTLTADQTTFEVSDLRAGDTIVWVWYASSSGTISEPGTPSSILAIMDGETPVSWSIGSSGPTFLDFSNADGSDNYPNYCLWGMGENSPNEAMYLIVYPVTGFTDGAYTLEFTLPSYTTSKIAWGKILRGLDMSHLGECVQTYAGNILPSEGYVDAPYRITGYLADFPMTRSITNGVDYPAYIVCITNAGQLLDPPPSEYGTQVSVFTTNADNVALQDVGIVASAGYTFVDPGENPGPAWGLYDDGAATTWLILRSSGWTDPLPPTVYFADMIVFNAATSTGVEF